MELQSAMERLHAPLDFVPWQSTRTDALTRHIENVALMDEAQDPFASAELLYAYTRKDALADGVQIDVSELAREAGVKFPVYLTRSVWESYVTVPDGVRCQDEEGRVWDIVWMLRVAARRTSGPEMLFRLHVRNDNRDRTPPLVNLKAVCGPRDIDEPQAAITVMLPNEDRNRPHHLRQRAMPEFGTELTLRVRVKYCVLPGESGSRDRYGALETPQIDDDLEILAIVPLDEWLTVRNGEVELKSWQLPPTMRNEIEAEAHADYQL